MKDEWMALLKSNISKIGKQRPKTRTEEEAQAWRAALFSEYLIETIGAIEASSEHGPETLKDVLENLKTSDRLVMAIVALSNGEKELKVWLKREQKITERPGVQ